MKVCYFGIYDSEYSRNKILISGLRQNNVEVVECRTDKKGFSKYLDLIKLHKLLVGSYDVMVVGYPGFQAMILAKFLTDRPIVFDAFVSIYDSMVSDRAQVGKISLKAFYFWCLDKISLSLANIILFDTQTHIDFVSKKFGIKKEKFRRIFVGADTNIFYPKEKKENSEFKVVFYGHFIPLQGTEYIVRAAKALEGNKDVSFEIIGDGQERKKVMALVKDLNIKNINFTGNVSLEELSIKISEADVCLGVFGNSEKTKRVIPNKVYECIAMKKPVITADTPAIRELFNESDIFLAVTGDYNSIAKRILDIKSNYENAIMITENAYNKFRKYALPMHLGNELRSIVQQILITTK